MTPSRFGTPADWRAWVAGVPETDFPLTTDALLQWLRQNNRVPSLFWDQFRTRLISHLGGEEWDTPEAMLRDLETVDWGF
jgi:hypothetical protein